MRRLSICLAAAALAVLAGCGNAQPAAPKATVAPRTLVSGVWTAEAICPTVRAEINKHAPWAVQPDNTNRVCIVIGQEPPVQGVGALVDLRGGGSGKCPDRHFTDNTHAVQVSGLGAQACMVTHSDTGSRVRGAVVEWGIFFNAEHSIDINCENQTNPNLGQLMPQCRMVLQAVLASLYRS